MDQPEKISSDADLEAQYTKAFQTGRRNDLHEAATKLKTYQSVELDSIKWAKSLTELIFSVDWAYPDRQPNLSGPAKIRLVLPSNLGLAPLIPFNAPVKIYVDDNLITNSTPYNFTFLDALDFLHNAGALR